MSEERPTGPVRVTMYQVGFGDCFMLSFPYQDRDRHVLIDCGTSSNKADHMADVAAAITEDCGGHLDAIVATHRHSDHLSAFGLKDAGATLFELRPDLVVQPWTEHPEAEEQASQAPSTFSLAQSLTLGQEYSEVLLRRGEELLPGASSRRLRYIQDLSKLNISNKRAVARLQEIGDRHAWVHAGGESGLADLLPGLTVTVLGPPTLEQCGEMKTQARWDEAEYWKLQGGAGLSPDARALFPDADTVDVEEAPSYVRWVTRKLDALHVADALRIVTRLNRALNNTSVILLFEVGETALLFPGDAQLESWRYVLGQEQLRERLTRVRLYKVGHHGSTNATPRSLWELFEYRGTQDDRLTALLSTEEGEHPGVPRESLVTALAKETDLHSTEHQDQLRRMVEL